MAEQPWFKHWGKLSLASNDLNDMTDHEERVWWRLLAVGSSAPERWHIRMSRESLARVCASTPAKLLQVMWKLEKLHMAVTEADGAIFLLNAERYQETPDARRKRTQRERTSHGHVPDMSQDMSHEMSRESHGDTRAVVRGERREVDPSETNVSSGGRAKRAPSPKKSAEQKLRDALPAFALEEPTLDIPALADDYLNWTGSAKHTDKVQGFRNQLRIGWKREQFTKAAAPAAPRPTNPHVGTAKDAWAMPTPEELYGVSRD